MTREVWRARIVTEDDSYHGGYRYHEVIEKAKLEELLTEIQKELPKNNLSNKVSAYDVEEDYSIIEHVVVLEEMTIEKAVTIINAKAVADKELMAKVNEYEALKKAVNDMTWKTRDLSTEIKKLVDSIHSDERAIGGHVAQDEPDNKYYQQILERCRADRVKLKNLWAEQDKLGKEYEELYEEKEDMKKELGV